jgi:3-deoxy-manno-octulosonate cytidylyltransferase (CMP-KDO synthetase)
MKASTPTFTVVIPARLASTRLPHKPLVNIAGLPMVVRVAQRAALSMATSVVVAADHLSIVQACNDHGIRAILTRNDHPSGSDRLAEACEVLEWPDDALVVNVQGDEPLMDPDLINKVATLLHERPEASMSTAAHAIESVDEFQNPNVVKVILNARQMAMYFSRAPVPWWRDGNSQGITALPDPRPLRHIGIYGYRAGFLKQFPLLPQAPVEMTEALEQMRAMWHGHQVAVHVTLRAPGPGVDTPEDLQRVRSILTDT